MPTVEHVRDMESGAGGRYFTVDLQADGVFNPDLFDSYAREFDHMLGSYMLDSDGHVTSIRSFSPNHLRQGGWAVKMESQLNFIVLDYKMHIFSDGIVHSDFRNRVNRIALINDAGSLYLRFIMDSVNGFTPRVQQNEKRVIHGRSASLGMYSHFNFRRTVIEPMLSEFFTFKYDY